MVTVVDLYGVAAERTNALGPKPGMVRFVREMAREVFLQIVVVRPVDESQNQISTAQFRVSIITKQQNVVGFFVHANPSMSEQQETL